MDLSSTGSTISKMDIEESFKVAELVERKLELNETEEKKEQAPKISSEEQIDLPKKKDAEVEELTIDDFLGDFKL